MFFLDLQTSHDSALILRALGVFVTVQGVTKWNLGHTDFIAHYQQINKTCRILSKDGKVIDTYVHQESSSLCACENSSSRGCVQTL